MLFKWLFTVLAIWWLIRVFRPYFQAGQGTAMRQMPPDKKDDSKDDDGDYIDYEEITDSK